jgi:hypothetical protein
VFLLCFGGARVWVWWYVCVYVCVHLSACVVVFV